MTGNSGYRFEYYLHLIKIPSHVDRESIYTSNLLVLNACMYVLSLAGQARLLYILATSSSRVASARSRSSKVLKVLVTRLSLQGKPPQFSGSCLGAYHCPESVVPVAWLRDGITV